MHVLVLENDSAIDVNLPEPAEHEPRESVALLIVRDDDRSAQDELSAFLAAAEQDALHYPLFLLLARTGLRPGEAFGLQWGDLDLGARELRVERSWSLRRIETPKTGRTRRVDMSEQLVRTLRRLEIDRLVEKMKRG